MVFVPDGVEELYGAGMPVHNDIAAFQRFAIVRIS
jgi:hypothetical protein